MFRKLALLPLLAALAVSSFAQAPPMIGMGDSIGEGVQSADASWRTQPHSYLNLIAAKAGAAFPLPLIKGGPFTIIFSVRGRTRIQPNLAAANLAVSGADVHSILYDAASTPITTETDLVLSPRTGSQMDIAAASQAPFIVCWIGNNDVLGAVLAFDQLDATQMTPLADFTADYATLVSRLQATGAKVVLGNIPDVSNIGFLFNRQDLIHFTGSDFGLPDGSYTSLVAMLLLKMGLADATLLQNPAWVLDPSEVQAIQARVTAINQVIAQDAAAAGMPVVDIHSIFQSMGQNPPVILGVPLSTHFLGGLLSLDGVHPSDIGHALAANAFIATANQAYGMNIPQYSLAELQQIMLRDPFIDWDGDYQVAGRPLAGLLETLGPALGISGDFNNAPSARPQVDPSLAPAFMRQGVIAALRHVLRLN